MIEAEERREEMAFCTSCGRQVSDDADFCPACGATMAPPPAGAPPAHVPGAVPPPPRKQGMRPGCKIALIVTVIVVLVVGAAIAALAIFVFRTVKAPVDATNRYIEAINDGDTQEAWGLLHPNSRFREEYGESTFEMQIVEPSAGTLRTWNANEAEVSDSRARVEVDMEFTDGTDMRVSFELRKDGDDWKVYDYTSPGGGV